MCEVLAGSALPEEKETLFTIGLFSVADALLDAPMAEVLGSLPVHRGDPGALLRREGAKGELLSAVIAYERGEFPRYRPPRRVAGERLPRGPRVGRRGGPGRATDRAPRARAGQPSGVRRAGSQRWRVHSVRA